MTLSSPRIAAAPAVPPAFLSPAALKALLAQPGECALLDVGEEGEFGMGHLLRAVNVPYSVLELRVRALVPRRACPVVLVDHGNGMAERAARRLHASGYADVRILEGGMPAWRAAGHEVFHGVFVPSKAFGEWVEHAHGTPSIEAQALAALLAQGADVRVLDPRTVPEHAVRHVPGAASCPGAELIYRFDDLVDSPESLVVVACGGRTRGIVGAQLLIDAGVPNRVVALADGNHGWQLAGLALETGLHAGYGVLSDAARAGASARVDHLVRRHGLSRIGLPTLERWLAPDAQSVRTTFVLDVRTPEEYAAGHLPGSRSAPGGQLVQATDRWLGTLGARVVLVDDHGARAAAAARCLGQMGWEAHMLCVPSLADPALAGGSAAAVWQAMQVASADEAARVAGEVETVATGDGMAAEAAAAALAAGAQAVSVDRSEDFLRAHPPGAIWANRARLEEAHGLLQAGRTLLLFSQDGSMAHLAARDLREALPAAAARVQVVRGGLAAWQAAGQPVASLPPEALPEAVRVDVLYWAHDRRRGNAEAMRAYLDWEKHLLGQVAADGFAFGAAADRAGGED